MLGMDLDHASVVHHECQPRVRSGSALLEPDVLQIVRAQIQLITKSGHTGLLTFGVLGALWSSSSAMNATIDTLNRAYGIKEARPWWKVQFLAIVLTIIMSLFALVAFTLVVAGPEMAETVAAHNGLGPAFAWTWKIVQWPFVFLLISEGFAFVYYRGWLFRARWHSGIGETPDSKRAR